jgi:hypothetical protein
VANAARRAEGYREGAPILLWPIGAMVAAVHDELHSDTDGITPAAEAVDADPEIVAMGRRSLSLWPQWLAELAPGGQTHDTH